MIKKLRRKFVCINMLIVTLMLFAILGLTVSMTRSSLEEDSLETLRASYAPDKKEQHPEEKKEEKTKKPDATTASSETPTETGSKVAEEKSPPAEGKGSGKEEKYEKTRREFRMPTFTLTYSESGTLMAEGSDFYDLSDPEYLENLMADAQGRGTEYGVIWHHSLRFLRNTEKGTSYSFMDISGEQATLWDLLLHSVMIGILAFGGFLILSILLARWAIRPVEKAWTQQQQFVADASHELKTPLTVIITSAELLEESDIKPEARQKCVDNILETSKRMRSLTEEMLTLARAENVQEEMMEEYCTLSEIMEDSVLSFEPLFYERGLELQWEIEPDAVVKGNEIQLRRLGDILLDNAQKYSLPGTTNLTLKKQGSKVCELTLSNPAKEMSKEDLERLFERFYRADPARTATGSFGLGLSIASGIVRRHRGTIKATQQDEQITFSVRLPLSS